MRPKTVILMVFFAVPHLVMGMCRNRVVVYEVFPLSFDFSP